MLHRGSVVDYYWLPLFRFNLLLGCLWEANTAANVHLQKVCELLFHLELGLDKVRVQIVLPDPAAES